MTINSTLPVTLEDHLALLGGISATRIRLAPNLAVKVLSPGNTIAEMARKRMEYFRAGVEVVWMVDCHHRSVAVFSSPTEMQVYGLQDAIDGRGVLPGFSAQVSEFFIDLDFGQEDVKRG